MSPPNTSAVPVGQLALRGSTLFAGQRRRGRVQRGRRAGSAIRERGERGRELRDVSHRDSPLRRRGGLQLREELLMLRRRPGLEAASDHDRPGRARSRRGGRAVGSKGDGLRRRGGHAPSVAIRDGREPAPRADCGALPDHRPPVGRSPAHALREHGGPAGDIRRWHELRYEAAERNVLTLRTRRGDRPARVLVHDDGLRRPRCECEHRRRERDADQDDRPRADDGHARPPTKRPERSVPRR